MKVEVKEMQSNEVDWTKNPQLVVSGDVVVLTAINQTSEEDEHSFVGICVKSGTHIFLGDISNNWAKKFFKPFHGSITLSND